jgi:hypothetical protein
VPRLLKIDSRPVEYDSLAEASLGSIPTVVNATLETGDWHPITPPPGLPLIETLAFVDGVQRIELRLSAEGDGYPIPGALASCAAGAVCIGAEPRLRHVQVDRRVILANGATTASLCLRASNGEIEYRPAHDSGQDFDSINRTLNDLRSNLEVEVVRELIKDKLGLIVVDGRLPDVRHGPIVGLIKTLQNLYLSDPAQLATLESLGAGQRSPVFSIERARTAYYSWFVCLRTPGPFDLALSGLARMEMDDSVSREEAFRFADRTALMLPAFASNPNRDARAPQNLLPIGQLEQALRHQLGDPELLKRLVFKAFREEKPEWNL